MIRWIRVVIPHEWLAGYLLIYVVLELRHFFFPGPGFSGGEFVLMVGAIAYGAYRVAAFHPALRPDYRKWLESTPWTTRLPLPIGPAHFVPQDFLVLAGFALLASRHPDLSWPLVPLLTIVAWLVVICPTFWICGRPFFAYLVAFGLGLVVRLIPHLSSMWVVAATLFLAATIGLRQSLARFPWNMTWFDESDLLSFSNEGIAERFRRKLLGWPWDKMQPKRSGEGIGYLPGTLISLLAGWWLHALLSLLPPQAPQAVGAMPAGIACVILFISRIYVYCRGYAAPISFWGRVLTFRWLIPGYDVVFAAPLLTAMIMKGAAFVEWKWNVEGELLWPATLTAMLLVTLLTGPTLDDWRLSGKHRIHLGFSRQKTSLGASIEQRELVEL